MSPQLLLDELLSELLEQAESIANNITAINSTGNGGASQNSMQNVGEEEWLRSKMEKLRNKSSSSSNTSLSHQRQRSSSPLLRPLRETRFPSGGSNSLSNENPLVLNRVLSKEDIEQTNKLMRELKSRVKVFDPEKETSEDYLQQDSIDGSLDLDPFDEYERGRVRDRVPSSSEIELQEERSEELVNLMDEDDEEELEMQEAQLIRARATSTPRTDDYDEEIEIFDPCKRLQTPPLSSSTPQYTNTRELSESNYSQPRASRERSIPIRVEGRGSPRIERRTSSPPPSTSSKQFTTVARQLSLRETPHGGQGVSNYSNISFGSPRRSLSGTPSSNKTRTKFIYDNSHQWYWPSASREETVNALLNSPEYDELEGAFLIRNSYSFPGAFGLCIKVRGDGGTFNVRHFLIEPVEFGVRLRGATGGKGAPGKTQTEPVFGSLSALVYAHTIDQLALPTKLKLLPDPDMSSTSTTPTPRGLYSPSPPPRSTPPIAGHERLASNGASMVVACRLVLLGICDVERLTGDEGVSRGINHVLSSREMKGERGEVIKISLGDPVGHGKGIKGKKGSKGDDGAVEIQLGISKDGLTLTDLYRKRFFRQHYPIGSISYAGIDQMSRTLFVLNHKDSSNNKKLFGIIAGRGQVPEIGFGGSPSVRNDFFSAGGIYSNGNGGPIQSPLNNSAKQHNDCIVLAELEENQPAEAIVAFFLKAVVNI